TISRFNLEEESFPAGRVLANVIIPGYITVHLGTPDSNAQNMRVAFKDYIKNVASHEIFDTWKEAALIANIWCIISFTLNRIYTEFYRSRGYNFDITNSTTIDHYFKPGGAFGSNISRVVDYIFNEYLAIIGHKEPFLAQYCDGNRVKCPGWLSQWGSAEDAERGLTAWQIIDKYYAYDLELRESNIFSDNLESYPGYTISEGDSGEYVRKIQEQLNRISGSFYIPAPGKVDGIFGPSTVESVKAFQRLWGLTPDGKVGKATWYEIQRRYNAVKGLSEMNSEGEHIGIGTTPPTVAIKEGATGQNVARLQFLLNYIGKFNPNIPYVVQNSKFDAATKNAVIAFQREMGLKADGIVGSDTWRALYNEYWGIVGHTPSPPSSYPGYYIRKGQISDDVLQVQKALNRARSIYPSIPAIAEDSNFGSGTEEAVKAFQRAAGLSADGIVGQDTWNALMNVSTMSLVHEEQANNLVYRMDKSCCEPVENEVLEEKPIDINSSVVLILAAVYLFIK
ncbi:MAG: peptidoglycan-binding protein, partial [Defluviitaleaceae bacterium]|nr:peptidoglycan-binding protein [Defluviitaleaceae bacterium]